MKKDNYIDKDEIISLFQGLNQHDIKYYVISNVADKIPMRLLKGKDIDIVVHKDSWEKYLYVMNNMGFIYEKGAKTTKNGWQLYNGTLDCVKLANRKENGLEIDAASDLCLEGFQPAKWIPMAQWINDYAWKNRYKDLKCDGWYLDDFTMIAYLVAHCVFDKKTFSEEYKETIYKYRELLDEEIVQKMLRTVFFGFTDMLISMIKSERYDEIYKEYFAFAEY